MTDQQRTTWWHEHNEHLRHLSEDGSAQLLSTQVCELLDDVEAQFAVTGANAPGWPGRPVDESPREEEYSRCLNPQKFHIVPARVEAWANALVDRGWARRSTEHDSHSTDDFSVRKVVLRPVATGSVALTFSIYDSPDPESTLNVVIAAGDPPFDLAEVPGCGCDACDHGSAQLLEDLDQWVLSVVDGSLVVNPADDLVVRTSFGGGGMATRGDADIPSIVAAPWAQQWTPRPVLAGPAPSFPGTERFPRTVIGIAIQRVLNSLLRKPDTTQSETYYWPEKP